MSNKPKLILHVGTHKTGTTAIQRFAADNADYLYGKGLYYPDFEPYISRRKDGHHAFAHAFSSRKGGLDVAQVSDLVSRWHRRAESSNKTVMVSAEAMYRHVWGEGSFEQRRENYLFRIRDVLSDFDVHPVVVFRRPDNYIRSLYQERVMRRLGPMPDFKDYISASFQPMLEYSYNADLVSTVFSRVECLLYEQLSHDGDLISNFFSSFGFDVSGGESVGRVRQSLSVTETLVKNYANEFIERPEQGQALVRWMRKPKIASFLHSEFGRGDYDLWPSHKVRLDFLNSRQDDLNTLHKSHFPDLKEVFPALGPTGTKPCVPALPYAVKLMIDDYFSPRRGLKKLFTRRQYR